MLKNKIITTLFVLTLAFSSKSQTLKLDAIIDSITVSHPVVKMYNNEIRSMDEAAKGAKSWMPPEFSTGFWMTPYNPALWKKGDMGTPGMGQYMIGGQQMVPNKKKQNADAAYMEAMSSVEKEKKMASLNELISSPPAPILSPRSATGGPDIPSRHCPNGVTETKNTRAAFSASLAANDT